MFFKLWYRFAKTRLRKLVFPAHIVCKTRPYSLSRFWDLRMWLTFWISKILWISFQLSHVRFMDFNILPYLTSDSPVVTVYKDLFRICHPTWALWQFFKVSKIIALALFHQSGNWSSGQFAQWRSHS